MNTRPVNLLIIQLCHILTRSGQCSCAVDIPPWIYVDTHLEIFIRYEWDRFPSLSDLLVEWATALTSRGHEYPMFLDRLRKKRGFHVKVCVFVKTTSLKWTACLSRSRSNDEESVVQWSPLISLPRDGSLAVSLSSLLMLPLWPVLYTAVVRICTL